ncbi:MAG: substrate-binding periplasmic protein [Labrenzia sp.]
MFKTFAPLATVAALVFQLTVSTNQARAQERIHIEAFEIRKLIEPDGSGFYLNLFNALQLDENWNIKLRVVPVLRAAENFENRRIDCMFPTSEFAIDAGSVSAEESVFSDPINFIRLVAYVKNGVVPPARLSDLSGKSIAFRHGFHLPEDIKTSAALIERVPTLQSGYQMLRAGRVDVLLAYIPDFLIFSAENGIQDVGMDRLFYLHPQREMILCRKSDKTERFIRAFNAALDRAKSNGVYAHALGPSMVHPIGSELGPVPHDKGADD